MRARKTLQIPQTTPLRTRSTLLQRLCTCCESRVGCVYYSSDRIGCGRVPRAKSSTWNRTRSQDIASKQYNTYRQTGVLLSTLSRPLELRTGCSLRLCAADRTKSEVDQKRRRRCCCCCCYLGGLRHDALCAPLCNTGPSAILAGCHRLKEYFPRRTYSALLSQLLMPSPAFRNS